MSYPQGPQGGAWLPPPTDYYAQQQPRRSAIPKVIGILMIVFASLGLVASLIGLAMDSNWDDPNIKRAFGDQVSSMKTYESIDQISGLLIGILHLYGGIMCVMYKRSAPALAISYAAVRILHVVVTLVLLFAWLSPLLDKVPEMRGPMMVGMIFGGILGIAWPIVIWALMSRPSARAACDR